MFFLFCIGAVAGTFLDALLTSAGIAFYAKPVFFGEAWWVPFLFGFATLGIGFLHRQFLPGKETARSHFFISFNFLILVVLLAGYLEISNFEKAILLFALYLLSWGIWDRTLLPFVFALLTAVCGSALESGLSQVGCYTYVNPDFMGIPYWLPFLYLHVSQSAGYLGRVLLPR